MKFIKIIGLISLICLTFFYTDKVIDVTINQDPIMSKIKEYSNTYNTPPKNALIDSDYLIPGNTGSEINELSSYKEMKKIGYYEPSLFVYNTIYPEISMYNNLNKYIIKGNPYNKSISLIYILNNTNTIDGILEITNRYNIKINFFIDSSFLNNNISIIDKLKDNEIYNYGNNGVYTKDNLIITNNIINNKSNNKALYCLFLKKDNSSLSNCANNKMLSIIPKKNINYFNIKSNLENGSILLIDNTKELNGIIEYTLSKGYSILPLSSLVKE